VEKGRPATDLPEISAPSADPIITIKGLTKRFGAVTALEAVDLEISRGELFGLLGPNGAGKTTLLSILSTIIPSSSGIARVSGHDVAKNRHQVRKTIGIVFQDPTLDEELTGEENLDFHGRLYGLVEPFRSERTDAVLKLVELGDRRRDLVKTYSGGMRRRLELARGLMHSPMVLFLDEPTLGLDPQTRRRIWDYIAEMRAAAGMTIILTTHYMDEADKLCDRIAIIDRGRIIALDTPERFKSSLGGDLVEVAVGDGGQALLETARRTGEVKEIVFEDGLLTLAVRNGESFIPRLFGEAQRLGIEISSVSLRKPNLEDVFIKLTGREIRGETEVDVKERMRMFMQRRRR
jgi:ABC-2 type transport system ATP-binding protein